MRFASKYQLNKGKKCSFVVATNDIRLTSNGFFNCVSVNTLLVWHHKTWCNLTECTKHGRSACTEIRFCVGEK